MKKVISVLLMISICLSMLAMITSCSLLPLKHPIEKFKEKMDKEQNYQVTLTMKDVPFLGTLTMTTQRDGNIGYTPAVLFSEEEYTETVGETKYKYTKNDNGKWIKSEVESVEDDDSITGEDQMDDLFDPDNYEKVKDEKNTYKQKDDADFGEFKDIVMTVDDDSCVIKGNVISKGVTCPVTIEISKIGEIELTLPNVD